MAQSLHSTAQSNAHSTVFPSLAEHFVLPRHFDLAAARVLLRQVKAIPVRQLPHTLHIDCSQAEAIDSGGLGALLLIGEYLGSERTLRLEGARGPVQDLLRIARIEERLARPDPSWPVPPSGHEQLAGAHQR